MPKIVEHDQYRRELLDGSFEVFAAHGYAAVTMRQLAEALGVSTGTLYHYFPGKKAIFEQLIDHIAQQDTTSFTAEIAGLEPLEVKLAAFFAYFERHEDYFQKQLLLLIDYYRQLDREEVRNDKAMQSMTMRYEQLFIEQIGVNDPILFKLFTCFFDGLTIQQIYAPADGSIAEVGVLLTRMLKSHLAEKGLGG